MAKKRVMIDPSQKILGNDFQSENILGQLAYLADDNFNVDGAAQAQQPIQMPQQMPSQQFQNQIQQSPEEQSGGLELLGRLAEDEAMEDSIDAMGETQPPPEYDLEPEIDMNQLAMLNPEPEQEILGIPTDETGKRLSPIDAIRQAVEGDPSLMNLLPPETQQLLSNPESPLAAHQMQEVQEMGVPTQGAFAAATHNPQIMATLSRMDGLAEGEGYPPEVQEKVEMWENIFNKQLEDLDRSEMNLIEKAQSGGLTQEETIGLGLGILAPTLLALFFGKEAAFSAIGGGLEGAAKFMNDKKEGAENAQDLLGKINEKKTDLLDKDAKFRKDFLSTIQDPKLRKHVQEKGYRTLEEFGKVGIPEMEDLGVYLDADKFTGDEDYENFRKEWPDDRQLFANQKEFNLSLNEMEDLLQALKDQDVAYYNVLGTKIKGKVPKSWRDWFGEGGTPYVDIVVNGELKHVNALQQLEAITNRFQSSYMKAQKFDNRLTNNMKTHSAGVVPNPAHLWTWLEADSGDLLDKVKTLKNDSNRYFVQGAASKGYLAEPLEAVFPFGEYQVMGDTTRVQNDLIKNPRNYMDKVVK